MNVELDFEYTEEGIPPRCRKPRPVAKQGNATVVINEVSEGDFPVAFVVHDKLYDETPEIRTYRGHEQNRCLYVYSAPATEETVKRLLAAQMLQRNTLEEAEAVIRDFQSRRVIFNGEIWERTEWEPCYEVCTFGLGSNHGGTALMLGTAAAGANVEKDYIFRADELEAAKAAAEAVALGRGDTESVASIRRCDSTWHRIEVYRIDFSRLLDKQDREAARAFKCVNTVLSDALGYDVIPRHIASALVRKLTAQGRGEINREAVLRELRRLVERGAEHGGY